MWNGVSTVLQLLPLIFSSNEKTLNDEFSFYRPYNYATRNK